MKLYKYYTMRRPPGRGSITSKGLRLAKSYSERRDDCMGGMVRAWGWALYERPLSMDELLSYELAYGGEVER